MNEVNKKQIGGTHYKSAYEHWDWVLDLGMGYLEGQATKYVCRWRKKEGLKDLRKAEHYVEKMLQRLRGPGGVHPAPPTERHVLNQYMLRLAMANDLTSMEETFCFLLASWQVEDEIVRAKEIVQALIKEVLTTPTIREEVIITERKVPRFEEPTTPGTPEDGGHHVKQHEPAEFVTLSTCDHYWPDYQAMGDCWHCGHTKEAHDKRENLPSNALLNIPPHEWRSLLQDGIHPRDVDARVLELYMNVTTPAGTLAVVDRRKMPDGPWKEFVSLLQLEREQNNQEYKELPAEYHHMYRWSETETKWILRGRFAAWGK